MSRTTHSDLARILRDHAAALLKIPAVHCVSDASTQSSIEAAAALLVKQDERIERMTIALRDARASLKAPADSARREWTLAVVNAALGPA